MIRVEELKYLLQKRKFADSEWLKRGLNPSSQDLCEILESNFDNCLISLIDLIEKSTSKDKLKKQLQISLKSFNKFDFDTEEREFICDYFFEISNYIDVDFRYELNKWLYGYLIALFVKGSQIFKKGKENKLDKKILSSCTSCSSKLIINVIQEEENIDLINYLIVKCKNCNEYNLLNVAGVLNKVEFEGFELIEELSGVDYSLDEAKTRLKQIKFFR